MKIHLIVSPLKVFYVRGLLLNQGFYGICYIMAITFCLLDTAYHKYHNNNKS